MYLYCTAHRISPFGNSVKHLYKLEYYHTLSGCLTKNFNYWDSA